MKSINFPGANVKIGPDQPEYNTLHAMEGDKDVGELIMCFELTDQEIEQLVLTKRLYYSRLTFGQPFQPLKLFVKLSDDKGE